MESAPVPVPRNDLVVRVEYTMHAMSPGTRPCAVRLSEVSGAMHRVTAVDSGREYALRPALLDPEDTAWYTRDGKLVYLCNIFDESRSTALHRHDCASHR